MHPETLSLIRKEWYDRRMPLAAGSGWMLCCVLYTVASECAHPFRDPVASFYQGSQLYGILGAIFLAMKTALGEQTHGTLGFSLSLPVTRKRLAWTRLASGVLALAVPFALGALVMTPILASGLVEEAQLRSSAAYIPMQQRASLSAAGAVGLLWTVTAIAIASAVQLLLILSIVGTRLRSESSIGFFGAVLAFAWTVLPGFHAHSETIDGWLGALFPVSLIINWGYGGEGGSYADPDLGTPLWAPLMVNMLVLALLARWFVGWYGTQPLSRQSRRTTVWRRRPVIWSRIPFPLPGRLSSLVWINLRQSLPVAVCGLILAALITLLSFSEYEPGQNFRSQLPSSTWFVAALWAAVVGTGIFAAELQPGLSGFWRSRPISVRSWFWCKFFTGLIAVLLVLDGATIFVSWGTPIGYTSGMSLTYVACMPVLHATLYAVAVLGVCWIRRPVVAGMLTVAGYMVASILVTSVFGVAFDPIGVYNNVLDSEMNGEMNLAGHNYPLVYSTLMAIIVACAWLAYRAILHPESPVSVLLRRLRVPFGNGGPRHRAETAGSHHG